MIFTILKVIGIILLVVLALTTYSAALRLFVPVKYRAVGSFDNTRHKSKSTCVVAFSFVCTAYRVCTGD